MHPCPENPSGKISLPGRRLVLTWALFGLCLLLVAIELVQFGLALAEGWRARRTFDDAFAFCRYADHLLAGWGLAWNIGGPQTYGCTSLLYTFWVALLRWLTGLQAWEVLALGAWIPAAGAILLMGLAGARTAEQAELRHPLVSCGFACLCTFFQRPFFFHIETGMDTTLAILTNAAMVLVVVGPRFAVSGRQVMLAALVAYLAFLARPDNLLYAVFFPGLVILLGPASGRLGRLARFGITLAALLLIDTAVKTAVFGNPLPLPFYAKARGFYEGYAGAAKWNPVSYTRDFLLNQGPALAVLALTVGRHSWRLAAAGLLPCLLTFAYLGSLNQIMGYAARFYYPAMPLIVVPAYHALDRWIGVTRARPRTCVSWAFGGRVVGLALLTAAAVPLSGRAARWYGHRCLARQPAGPPYTMSQPTASVPPLGWVTTIRAMIALTQACPADVTWAMSEHGFVSAVCPDVTIIDLVGLHDRNTLTGRPVAQHALEQRPDVIWFPHPDYAGLVRAIQSSPLFQEHYDYWPGAFDYGPYGRTRPGESRSSAPSAGYGASITIPSVRCPFGAPTAGSRARLF